MKEKYALYILFLCALCQGCGSSKSVREKTDGRLISDSLVESKGTLKRQENETRTDSAKHNRQSRQERIVVLFDTDKPVSEKTGLPPVKEISLTGATLMEESQTAGTTYRRTDEQTDSSSLLRTRREEESKKEVQTHKKTKSPSLFWRIALPVCLIALAGFLTGPARSKIKAIWKRIFKG